MFLCVGVFSSLEQMRLLLSVLQRGNVARPTLTFPFCLPGPRHSIAVSRLFCFFFLSDCFHSSCQVSSVTLTKDLMCFKWQRELVSASRRDRTGGFASALPAGFARVRSSGRPPECGIR